MQMHKVPEVPQHIINAIINEQLEMINAGVSVVERAKTFAIKAHDSIFHKRKYTGADYWTHPRDVAATVEEFGGDEYQQSAAWLHDTIEDVYWVNEGLMWRLFGDDGDVVVMVIGLTDVSKPSDGVRKVRKNIDLLHTAEQSERTQFVKLADLDDNSACIVKNDPKFAKVYLVEKEALLTAMTKVRDSVLYTKVFRILEDGKAQLGI